MSDVNEVRKDNEDLNNALAYVRAQRPMDQAIQKKYINMENAYDAEISPLQKEFSEKLKEYMELSNQYYGRYVNISVAQNRERQASWDKQMQEYENYNNSTEAERRARVESEQTAWKAQDGKLTNDYNAAKEQYDLDIAEWKKQKAAREKLIEEAKTGLARSRTRREAYLKDSDPDYFSKTAKALKDRMNAMAITNPRQLYKHVDVAYMKNQNVHTVKRAAVIDTITTTKNEKVIYGIVGPDNAKRQTIDIDESPKKILIKIGAYGMTRNGPRPANRDAKIEGTERTQLSVSLSKYPGAFFPRSEDTTSIMGRNSKGNLDRRDSFDKEIKGNRLYMTRKGSSAKFRPNQTWGGVNQGGKGRGWGQDLHTYIYVPNMEASLTGNTVRDTSPTKIWGSALKRSDIWGRPVFGFRQADIAKLTIDKIPRWIHYPMGKWDDNTPLHQQENWGIEAKGTYKMYYNIFNVEYEFLHENPNEKDVWVVGAADDKCQVSLNSAAGPWTTFRGGWNGRPQKHKLRGKLHTGPNTVFVIQENGGGPTGMALIICKGTSDRPATFDGMVTCTGPDWLTLKSDIRIPGLDTNHSRRGKSFDGRYQRGSWLARFNNALTKQNLLGRVPGTFGMRTHDYKPPDAKVQFIRIEFGQLPASQTRTITLNQFQIFSTDRYDVNVAKGAFVKSSKLHPDSQPLERIVNGNDKPISDDGRRYRGEHVMTNHRIRWKDQFIEIQLPNPIEVFKVIITGNKGTGSYLANLRMEMYDTNRKTVFLGPPFSGNSEKHEFFFNGPIVPKGDPNPPGEPRKKNMSRDFPVFTPGKLPPYPIMPAYITPNEELLERLIMLSDDLITLNLRIQSVYKKFTMDRTIGRYQGKVLERRRDLVAEVQSLMKERRRLNEKVGEYNATRKNQIDQERRAESSQIHFWIWGCVTILIITLFVIYLMFPKYMIYTPQVMGWGIIILITLLTTMFIGGSITYMLWLFIVINIFFYLFRKYYG